MKKVLWVFLIGVIPIGLFAQGDGMKPLKYEDLSAFNEQAGNWFVVGDVVMNPTIDIHAHEEVAPEETTGKKKKKKKKNVPPPPPKPKAVTYQAGTGILLNMNDDTQKSHLISNWEHGDMIFETEVMIPKGSNSGIYLQGRYEVQLLDSWGVKNPGFGDIGGIYRNWESEPGKIYMGKAPYTNAAFAPGVWQHMKIAFKAPRFDAQGKKIANALFVYVELNGVRIHENLQVPLPTGGPIDQKEVAKGPLMIQGDHGPVAFRNTRYSLMESADIELKGLTYKAYDGKFGKIADFIDAEPVKTGKMPQLTYAVVGKDDNFGLAINGNIQAPAAGTYNLRLNYIGGVKFKIGDETLLDKQNPGAGGNQMMAVKLKQGDNPFELVYFKSIGWRPAMLGLFEANSFPRPLHNFSSFSAGAPNYSPIYVDVESNPKMLRAFYDFEGNKKNRLTHTIGVANPSGAHYIYDLKSATPVCVWRGEFVDATPMWNNRGDGSFRPRGAKRDLFTGVSIANITTDGDAFPSAINESQGFHNKGYKIHEHSGSPVFLYKVNDISIEDYLMPSDGGSSLTRSIKVTEGTAPASLMVKLAEGKDISQLTTGEYNIDKKYFIQLTQWQSAKIRTINGKKELVISLATGAAEYKIIW